MSLCVLVVDDSEADQFISEFIIKDFDDSIELIQAFDGQEALNLIREGTCTPDYIFLDINMPRMGGIQFLSIISDLTLVKKPQIYMLSSSIQEKDHQQCLQYSMVVDCLSKPLSVEQLQRCLTLSSIK